MFESSHASSPCALSSISNLNTSRRIVLGQLPLLTHRFRTYEIPDAAGQIYMALRTRIGISESELGVRIDQAMQVVGEPRNVAKLAEMGRVDRLRAQGNHALYRAVQRHGIELRRAGGGERELPPIAVELAVGKTEGIAGEDVAGAAIANHYVVSGMPGRIVKLERPPGERDARALRRLEDSLWRNR